MADSSKHYVLRGDKSLAEGMTKEEIITAIVNAIEQGEIGDIDTGFVTSLKEQNGGQAFKVWIGTEAQYQAITTPEKNVLYLISDDTTADDLEEHLDGIDDDIEALTTKTNGIESAFFTTGETGSNKLAYCAGNVESVGGDDRITFTLPLLKSLRAGQTFAFTNVNFKVLFKDGTNATLTDADETRVTGAAPNYSNVTYYLEGTGRPLGFCTVVASYSYEIN